MLVNEYFPGQSFGDPFLNETTAIHHRVTVGSKPAKIFYLMKSNYLQIYIDKLNDVNNNRLKVIRENYIPFNSWSENRLKNLFINAKERVMNNDECLIRERQEQPYIYMLISGKLRVERHVQVESCNYWPDGGE